MAATCGIKRRSALAALLLIGSVLSLGCSEGDEGIVDEGPLAQVLHVTHLDTGRPRFRYGTEVRVIFDRDPGDVTLDYGGPAPLYDLAGTGTTRAFILERSPTVLTWGNGGLLELEHDPIETIGQHFTRRKPLNLVPQVTAVNPVRLEREGILVLVGEPLGDALLIPVAALGRIVITGSDGSEWAPVGVSEGVNVRLLSDPEHPYLSGVTYQVSLSIEYAFAPGAGPTMVFQFTVR